MEARYDVGDVVYVMGRILTVEEQENDVRYSVSTSIAKYFCTEVNDTIRRSADSKGMLDKTFEDGREAYYDALGKISLMTEDQLKDCYGNNVHSMNDLFYNDDYDYAEIVDRYNEWWATLYTKVNDIVEYESNGEILTCVVMKVRAFSVNGQGETEYEDVDPDTLDPTILPNLAYILYDPLNQLIYVEISSENFTNTGRTFDINSYMEQIAADFADEDVVGLSMFEIDEDEVISDDDPDFIDDEYEEDDIDETEEPTGDEDSEEEGGDEGGDEPEEPDDNTEEDEE